MEYLCCFLFKLGESVRQSGSPATYWDMENSTIRNVSSGKAENEDADAKYFSRDDFTSRIAKTIATRGANVQATLMSINRCQTATSGQSTSGTSTLPENHISEMRSEPLLTYPDGVPSQSVIQDRMLRGEHFTSSPKMSNSTKVVGRDCSQDISLVSSISAPFELRPKAYDDTVISEQSTFMDNVDSREQSTAAVENQRLHHSDGAAQLISMRQSQSRNMTNPAVLPSQPISSVPVSNTQTLKETQVRRN